jgi:hypothetical protein
MVNIQASPLGKAFVRNDRVGVVVMPRDEAVSQVKMNAFRIKNSLSIQIGIRIKTLLRQPRGGNCGLPGNVGAFAKIYCVVNRIYNWFTNSRLPYAESKKQLCKMHGVFTLLQLPFAGLHQCSVLNVNYNASNINCNIPNTHYSPLNISCNIANISYSLVNVNCNEPNTGYKRPNIYCIYSNHLHRYLDSTTLPYARPWGKGFRHRAGQ